jgi:hypothetical protein
MESRPLPVPMSSTRAHHGDVPEGHLFRVQTAQLVADMDILWLKRESPAEFGDGFMLAARVGEHHGPVVGGHGVVAIRAAGALHIMDGLVLEPESVEDQCFLVECHCMCRVENEKLVPLFAGLLISATLGQESGENGEYVRDPVATGDDGAIAWLGGDDIACRLQVHGLVQQSSRRGDFGRVVRHGLPFVSFNPSLLQSSWLNFCNRRGAAR